MWKLSFLASLWTIWKERNIRYFEGKPLSVDSLVEKVKLLATLWVSPYPLFQNFSIDSLLFNWNEIDFSIQVRSQICSLWSSPPLTYFKLNFDGGVDGNPVLVGIGRVICDSSSLNVVSFSGPVGHCSINKAELLAVRQGL